VQSKLVDLLGYENLDFLMELVEYRQEIVDAILSQVLIINKAPKIRQEFTEVSELPLYSSKQRTFGPSVSITTQSEKHQVKLQRKQMKKIKKSNDEELDADNTRLLLGFDGSKLREAREQQLRNNMEKANLKPVFCFLIKGHSKSNNSCISECLSIW
jgi:hypothetical protein